MVSGVLNANTETFWLLFGDPWLNYGFIASYAMGNKPSPTVSAPADGTDGGRQVTISAITDGGVTNAGFCSFWALTDDSESKILASGPLSATIEVTDGQTFRTTEFNIGIPDPG